MYILVWLEVSVYDAIAVDVLQSQNCLSEVHPGHVQRQGSNILQQRRQVTSLHVFHHHVKMVLGERRERGKEGKGEEKGGKERGRKGMEVERGATQPLIPDTHTPRRDWYALFIYVHVPTLSVHIHILQ